MNRFLMLLVLTFLSCKTAAVTGPWKLEITSEGGFTGRGVGTISTDSDHASPELSRAVKESHPQKWAREYAHADAPNGYPDEVRYTLTLTTDDHRYVTSWRETAAVPPDLRAIHEAARAMR